MALYDSGIVITLHHFWCMVDIDNPQHDFRNRGANNFRKGGSLLQSELPQGDTILLGSSYFMTVT